MGEIIQQWDYKGWTRHVQGGDMQENWNYTLLTAINQVGKKIGVEEGGYLLVLVPEHMRSFIEPLKEFTKKSIGSYIKDFHYANFEEEIIEINGYKLEILNYNLGVEN